jgi:hypothetical protein
MFFEGRAEGRAGDPLACVGKGAGDEGVPPPPCLCETFENLLFTVTPEKAGVQNALK